MIECGEVKGDEGGGAGGCDVKLQTESAISSFKWYNAPGCGSINSL
jgi:hypothetical protein